MNILKQNGFPSRGSPSPQPSPQEGEGVHCKPNALGYRSRAAIFIVFGIFLGWLVGLTGCGREGQGHPLLIKIVSSLPRTGSENKQSTDIVHGFELAFEEAHGKVGKFRIQYEDWDDASPQTGNWDATLESSNAHRAVQDPDVMVYLGTYNSGAAKQSMPILNRALMLQVSPANTWPGLTKPGKGESNEPWVYRPTGKPNYCRVCPADDIQGPVGAVWAKKMGAKRVFILHDRELYGQGIAELFKRYAEKIGLKVIGFEGIDTQASNYNALAIRVRSVDPDLVYFGGTTQSNGGELAKDLRKGGYRGPLMVPDGCREQSFIDAAGKENVEGNTYATFGGLPPEKWTGRGKQFLDRFIQKYGSRPEPYAIYGYEAARVALEAIRRANKKDREAIRRAAFSIRHFEGALGKWSMDKNGDTSLTRMSGSVVRQGKWVFVTELSLEQGAGDSGQ